MNLINRAVSGFTLALALTVSAGCSGNIALVGRDTLPARATQPVPDELVATVERVNTASSEIFCARLAALQESSLTVLRAV
jgi:hypothetical protein